MGADYVYCPAGQWTHVSSIPAPFFHVNIYSAESDPVDVSWRRYMDAPPFYSEGTATLQSGQNRWAVPPALVNTWWFNPNRDCRLRMA